MCNEDPPTLARKQEGQNGVGKQKGSAIILSADLGLDLILIDSD